MQQVQQGSRDAYEALYARWKDRVFSFLHRRTLSLAQAEDAHQETWLRVYKWRERYDPAKPFRPWLYTIACHASHDAQTPDCVGFELQGSGFDPREARDILLCALHAIGGEDRRLLLLTVEGFTTSEVAKMMDLGNVAVRMRLHRARKRIRKAFDEA
jgi:RNA polymerase sigma-70 factor, ECF subfamily